MGRFIVKNKNKSIDNENEGEKLENNVTAMNKQPPENQEDVGEMQLATIANVAPMAKRRIRSIQEEHRKFQEKWTDKYLFVLHDGTSSLGLICQKAVNCFKQANLAWHLQLRHAHFDKTYPPQSNLRNNKIAQLKGQLKGQQQMMDRSSTVAEKTTEATYEIAWILERNKKAFSDEEFVK